MRPFRGYFVFLVPAAQFITKISGKSEAGQIQPSTAGANAKVSQKSRGVPWDFGSGPESALSKAEIQWPQ